MFFFFLLANIPQMGHKKLQVFSSYYKTFNYSVGQVSSFFIIYLIALKFKKILSFRSSFLLSIIQLRNQSLEMNFLFCLINDSSSMYSFYWFMFLSATQSNLSFYYFCLSPWFFLHHTHGSILAYIYIALIAVYSTILLIFSQIVISPCLLFGFLVPILFQIG